MPRHNLRINTNQHKAKNLRSKEDDLNIKEAITKTKLYLEERFKNGGGLPTLTRVAIILK
ncbi:MULTISPECIES: hypothetical protein [unclassified Campylobacter]|uniref:hypothetical protein n=1 Tax=unclassified Campylobacter TaxID=2593542 RepID=UPI001CC1DA38|nr:MULTISPECIES: hypothetical protein [unclassified Campylobacter]